jgi:hypothetical protein
MVAKSQPAPLPIPAEDPVTNTLPLAPDEFVYATTHEFAGIDPAETLCIFRENEGLTVICSRTYADRHGLPYEGSFRQVTLSVHSSLQAVGFLAVVSSALARVGIPCNVISAFYHDHIFVPSEWH